MNCLYAGIITSNPFCFTHLPQAKIIFLSLGIWYLFIIFSMLDWVIRYLSDLRYRPLINGIKTLVGTLYSFSKVSFIDSPIYAIKSPEFSSIETIALFSK